MTPDNPGTVAISPDDALETLLGLHDTGTRALYFTMLVLVVMALVAAPLTRVDVTIQSIGTLVSDIERQTLRNPSDGIVQRLLVKAGRHVRAGDTVMTLAPGSVEHARTASLSILAYHRAQRADLRQLVSLQFDGPNVPARHDMFRLEKSRAAEAEAEVEWRQASIQVRRTDRVRDRLDQLGRRGYAVPSELESAEFDVARAIEERALALERRRATWAQELADVEQQMVNLEHDVATRASEQAARHVIAPVSGTIEEIMSLSSGSVVRAGDPVAMISPDGVLIADVLVPPHDVVFLHPGMAARVIVDGYDAQEWGGVDGMVSSIAGDYTISDGRAVFRVRVRLVAAALRRADGTSVALGKGLRCQVRFRLGNRSLIELVRRRATEWFDPASPVAR